MPQGIRIVKEGFDISTRDPRNVAVDTTTVGSLKTIPTLHIKIDPATYTETYAVSSFTFGRIRIPHDFGFSPAFRGYVYVDNQYKTASVMPVGGLSFGGIVDMESNDEEVIINGLPVPAPAFDTYWMAIVIFKENLDAPTI